jgi:hypothetical protein
MPGGGGGKGNPKPSGALVKGALPEGSVVGGEEDLMGCCGMDGFELPKMLEKEKGEEEPVLGLSSTVLADVDEAGTVGLQEGAGWPIFSASSGSMAMNRSLVESIILLSIADSMTPLASSS